MRKAIVLLATIMLLAFISVLVAFSLSMVDRSLLKVKELENFTQTGILLKNIRSIMDYYSGKIKEAEECDVLLTFPISIVDKPTDVKVNIKFSPMATGINPNLLLLADGSENTPVKEIFLRILEAYKLKNPQLLLSFIEDTMDGDLAPRADRSEIALEDDIFFKNGKIEEIGHWNAILVHYASVARDAAVFDVPWQEVVSFRSAKIDFNYVSPFLLRQIFPKIDESTANEATNNKSKIFKNFSETGLDPLVTQAEFDKYFFFYNKSAPYTAKCELSYDICGATDSVTVYYDINTKKYGDVERVY